MRRRFTRETVTAFVLSVSSLLCSMPFAVTVAAQERPTEREAQAVLEKVDYAQLLNEQVPLDSVFTDESGKQVQLAQYFGKRPVILVMVFYECPMLCTEILNGTLRMMQELEFTAGKEYEVVTISIDPREGPVNAMAKKNQYLRRYDREGTFDSWHFLTGQEPEIRRVADSIGFKYFWDEQTAQYVHASGITVLTPTGRISHYFYGVQYDPGDVRLGLVEASANKIGSPVDKLLLFCYHYDPSSGKYNVAVMTFVRVFGVFTVLAMIGGFFMLMRRDRPDPVVPPKTGVGVEG